MNGYEWMTHVPMIRAMMDIYEPKFVLELGVGEYSTPVFMEYCSEYIGVDTDKTWIGEMLNRYDIKIHYQEIGEIGKRLNYSKITQEQRNDIKEYYKKFELPDIRPNLLFVDQDACCRLISINTLSPKFDIIIYHDHDHAGFIDNSYEFIKDEGFDRYLLTTPLTGTGLMVRREASRGIGLMQDRVNFYSNQFKERFPDCTFMKFMYYDRLHTR